jgi:hypothetical protein
MRQFGGRPIRAGRASSALISIGDAETRGPTDSATSRKHRETFLSGFREKVRSDN